MSEWKEIEIANVVISANTGLDAIKRAPIVEKNTGIKCLRIQDISQSKSYCNWGFTEVEQRNFEKFQLKKNDIIIARTGATIGVNLLIKENLNSVFNNGLIRVRTNKNLCDPIFLYYNFRSNNYYGYIESISGGTSTQPNMQINALLRYEISLPPLPEQTAIASILSSLDDKIDLLHRQNATLEKMAETLFRQWFIEEAKEEWEEVKIKDFDIVVTDFVANGSFASLKENVTLINDGPGYALFIRNTDLKSDFTQKVFVDEHAYNFLSKTKLFGGEVIISSVGDVGSVFRCPKFRIPMTLGNNVVMLKSKYNNFFYLFFNSDYGQSLIYGITSGSVQEKFNKTTFRDISIKYPSLDYIEEFEKLIKPYFDKIDNNKTQIRTLTTLRDTLLPKLMSGEVRVEY